MDRSDRTRRGRPGAGDARPDRAGRPAPQDVEQVVPGVVLERPVGRGMAGEVWRARSADGDRALSVVRVRLPPDPADRRRATAVADRLVALAHPHLHPVSSVVATEEGLALVRPHLAGMTLTTLLALRDGLRPGEVVTLGVPLAQALGAAHAAGLGHGPLTRSDVLITPDGRPVLTGVGLLEVCGRDPAAGAAEGPVRDLAALRTLCRQALATGDADGVAGPARERVHAALAAETPGAAAFADRLASAAAPEPLRGATPRARRGSRGAPDGGTLRARLRMLVPASRGPRLAGLVLGVVVVAVGLGWASAAVLPGGSGPRPGAAPPAPFTGPDPATGPAAVTGADADASAASAPSPADPGGVRDLPGEVTAPVDWVSVLERLDAARGEAFAAADPGVLADLEVPGSAAHLRDEQLVTALRGAGASAHTVRLTVESATEVSRDGPTVVLEVRDRLAPYDIVDAAGRVLRRDDGRGPATWLIELRATDGAWRIAEVSAVDT